jgi:hypothetical protein
MYSELAENLSAMDSMPRSIIMSTFESPQISLLEASVSPVGMNVALSQESDDLLSLLCYLYHESPRIWGFKI